MLPVLWCAVVTAANDAGRIRPYEANPFYRQFLDISRSAWQTAQTLRADGTVELKAPGKGHWAVLLRADRQTTVAIEGDRLLINGRPTYAGLEPKALGRLMNVRMVNSTFDDENPATRPQGLDPEANTT